jgi:hypothetical protein
VHDEVQLSYAIREGRVIFTHNTRDFIGLATLWQSAGRVHAGILLSHQIPLHELVRRFRAFLIHHQETSLANQVLWLPPLPKDK